VKCRDAATHRENEIHKAKRAYHTGLEPSIRATASRYCVLFGTMHDRLRGTQPRSAAHEKEQLLILEQEKSIVRFCESLDALGHRLEAKLVKAFAMSLLPPHQRQQLGMHWMTRFFNCHHTITTKICQHLDLQRANANDISIL